MEIYVQKVVYTLILISWCLNYAMTSNCFIKYMLHTVIVKNVIFKHHSLNTLKAVNRDSTSTTSIEKRHSIKNSLDINRM